MPTASPVIITVAGPVLPGSGDAQHRRGRGVVLGDQADDDAAGRAGRSRTTRSRLSRPKRAITKQAATMNRSGAPMVPNAQRDGGLAAPTCRRTSTMPISEADQAGGRERSGRHISAARAAASSMPRREVAEVRHAQGRCDRDGGDHGAAVALEDVRAHAGDVADVVADVVRDHARDCAGRPRGCPLRACRPGPRPRRRSW